MLHSLNTNPPSTKSLSASYSSLLRSSSSLLPSLQITFQFRWKLSPSSLSHLLASSSLLLLLSVPSSFLLPISSSLLLSSSSLLPSSSPLFPPSSSLLPFYSSYLFLRPDGVILTDSSFLPKSWLSSALHLNLLCSASFFHALSLSAQASGTLRQKIKVLRDQQIFKKHSTSAWLAKNLALLRLFRFYDDKGMEESLAREREGDVRSFGFPETFECNFFWVNFEYKNK